MPKIKPAKDIPLAPAEVFKNAVKHILTNSKKQSDADLAAIQASNAARRENRKHR